MELIDYVAMKMELVFISDIKYNQSWHDVVSNISVTDFDLSQWSKFLSYVLGKDIVFTSYSDVKKCLEQSEK